MRVALFLTGAAAIKHEDITFTQWQTESAGKNIFLDMYAEW